MRSRPTDGTYKRILRRMSTYYALSIYDIADHFEFSYRHAYRYITRLEADEVIYARYKHKGRYYYSLVRERVHATRKGHIRIKARA
jgi:DNA-binding transcriptional ArsR family regulator